MRLTTAENNIWFTSDTHFGHEKIIEYCSRPFRSSEEMDETLINNWNARVKTTDIVFHLGDFSFKNEKTLGQYRESLNGKIYLIRGNHDEKQLGKLKPYFEAVFDYLEIDVKDKQAKQGWRHICLFHYPIFSFNRQHYGALHCYGHVHNNDDQIEIPNSINVCVEKTDYSPVSYSDLIKLL